MVVGKDDRDMEEKEKKRAQVQREKQELSETSFFFLDLTLASSSLVSRHTVGLKSERRRRRRSESKRCRGEERKRHEHILQGTITSTESARESMPVHHASPEGGKKKHLCSCHNSRNPTTVLTVMCPLFVCLVEDHSLISKKNQISVCFLRVGSVQIFLPEVKWQ